MLTLHSKDFATKYGTISTVTEAFVEEERNGLFELSFIMLNTDSLFKYIDKENIVVCNANDTLLNQKFRIYMTRKLMNNRVEVFARHISFDLMYDYIDSLSFENQSCEYALNELFKSSIFSKHYKGKSDIINAQNYNIFNVNILSAIAGTKGSIIDTFGTGAEILRDNETISVLNSRGNDNLVTIEYRKNLTGFELEEDTTDLETRVGGYVKYKDDNDVEQELVTWLDSPHINKYAHPYINPEGARDYSSEFEDGEIPTIDKLQAILQREFTINKRDIVKNNFKIEFIPLSKCVGYDALSDKISLCDTVTIKDTRYNVDTKVKVIKCVFNVLKNRYESIELGEPRTSLGDIIGGGSSDKVTEDEVKEIINNTNPKFPNIVPATPELDYKLYGFSNIELSWTFENKVYYSYELYASKTKDFTPNIFDLIHAGQSSSFLFQAEPNETWYFKVCCINSQGRRTEFSNQVEVNTVKIDNLANYVGQAAIGDALIGELNLGRGWFGQLRGNYIDAKQLSVTDGNGKRTLDIDSFGNINLDVSSLNINNKSVESELNSLSTQLAQTESDFNFKVQNVGAENLIKNSDFSVGIEKWNKNGAFTWYIPVNGSEIPNEYGPMICIQNSGGGVGLYQRFNTIVGQQYTVSFYTEGYQQTPTDTVIGIEGVYTITLNMEPYFKRWNFTFTATSTSHVFVAYLGTGGRFYLGRVMITQGIALQEYRKHTSEIYSTNVKIDIDGVKISSPNTNTSTNITTNGFTINDTSANEELLKTSSEGVIAKGGKFIVTDKDNGSTVLWGRDVIINDQRALVGTNASPQSNMIANKLYVNYLGDFKNGTEITGKLTNNSYNVLSDVGSSITQNGYMKLNNGLIIQWGHVKGLTISNGQVVDAHIKYPIDFPNAIIALIPSIDTVDGNNWMASRYNIIGKSNNNKTHGWVYAVNHTGMAQGELMDINYIAIGC